MWVKNWALHRLEDAEPSLGVVGPAMWSASLALLATAVAIGLSVDDSGVAVAGSFALAAIMGLGTAPLWMVRVAVRRHARRQRHLRDDARAIRSHLEQAFVENRIAQEDFDASDRWLDDVRRGRSAAAVAATLSHYLRGTAWSLSMAGLIVGLAGAGAWLQLWEWQEYSEAEGLGPWMDASMTVGAVGIAAGFGGAVLFGLGARAAHAEAKRCAHEDVERIDALRKRLLAARRA